jgi:flavin-dependent dehydrogenase
LSPAKYDVAVLGGGPAGLASTIALLREGLGVIVIERTEYAALRVGEHLTPNTKPLLTALGLEGMLDSPLHVSCPGIRSAWGSHEPEDKDYVFNAYGEGWNLSRPEFDRSLALHVAGLGAEVLTRTKMVDISRVSATWQITLASEDGLFEVLADFAIDATGRSAALSKRMGSQPIVYDDLVGIFGRGADASPMSRWVLIEAQEEGWWYSAGLADGGLIATFLTDPDLFDLSQAGRAFAWRKQLGKSSITRARGLADGDAVDLHVRTARTQRLDRVAGEAWMAIGDAAMSFDPLSSEGISKGFKLGLKAGAIASAFCRGERSAAEAYEREADAAFVDYLATRRAFYEVEQRWRNAPFWRRRHALPLPRTRAGP